MQEEFRQINDYPNYSVSNFGNIKNNKTGRILKPTIDGNGYYTVKLFKDKKGKTFKIHRIVANVFLDNPLNKPFIDHIDGVRTNNNVLNLRYATNQENNQNRSMNNNNTTGFKGIYWHKKAQKWMASIGHNGKNLHLGLFETKEEATAARYEKAVEIQGEYINKCEQPIVVNINIQHADININQPQN